MLASPVVIVDDVNGVCPLTVVHLTVPAAVVKIFSVVCVALSTPLEAPAVRSAVAEAAEAATAAIDSIAANATAKVLRLRIMFPPWLDRIKPLH
jgi:hypothetical protein